MFIIYSTFEDLDEYSPGVPEECSTGTYADSPSIFFTECLKFSHCFLSLGSSLVIWLSFLKQNNSQNNNLKNGLYSTLRVQCHFTHPKPLYLSNVGLRVQSKFLLIFINICLLIFFIYMLYIFHIFVPHHFIFKNQTGIDSKHV